MLINMFLNCWGRVEVKEEGRGGGIVILASLKKHKDLQVSNVIRDLILAGFKLFPYGEENVNSTTSYRIFDLSHFVRFSS